VDPACSKRITEKALKDKEKKDFDAAQEIAKKQELEKVLKHIIIHLNRAKHF